MQLRLVYEGPLPSRNSVRPEDVQAIREYLHPQLREFWKTQYPAKHIYDNRPSFDRLSDRLQTDGVRYLPLISEAFGNVCSVDILLLRRGKTEKSVFTPSGDIDNRISTLFDALKWPKSKSMLGGRTTKPDDRGVFYCLVEDDKLITEVKVTADTLWTPVTEGKTVKHTENCVMAILSVTSSDNSYAADQWIGFGR